MTETLSEAAIDQRLETAGWADDRDTIFVDIRGVGLSRPSLGCPNVKQETYWELGADRWFEEVRSCADDWQQRGSDLARYNTREVVQDLVELQDKLGLSQWVLFGESYGTRPAMVFMGEHPERVEAAVLAGVFPPWVGRGEARYRHADRVLTTIQDICEADDDCAEKYPNIKDALLSAMHSASQSPQRLMIHCSLPMAHRAARARIDDAEILRWLSFHLARRGGIKTAPQLIDALAKSHYPSLSYLMANWPLYEEPYFTQGAHWSIWCNDAPDLQVDLLLEQARSLPYLSAMIMRAVDRDDCKAWPHADDFALATRRAGYATEIPTLILTGDFDVPTPREWAEETARALPRAILFNVPRGGHGYLDYSCAARAVDLFLKDPKETPDVACDESENRLVFQ